MVLLPRETKGWQIGRPGNTKNVLIANKSPKMGDTILNMCKSLVKYRIKESQMSHINIYYTYPRTMPQNDCHWAGVVVVGWCFALLN